MKMRSRNVAHGHSGCGFTLVEVLAVVSIMAMAAVITLGGLVQADDQARLQRFAGALQQLDRQARLQSDDGALDIAFHEGRSTIVLRATDSGTVSKRIDLPADMYLEISDRDRKRIDALRITRAGRSRDYRVRITLGAHRAGWHVAGLTGSITEQEFADE